MTSVIDLVLEDRRWQRAGLDAAAEAAAAAALGICGLDPARCEIGLLACDDARIAGLNATFRARGTATNVLSWPAFAGPIPQPGPEPLFLGDIALAYDTCAREAAAEGRALHDHAAHLVVHGCLHLLGHDHQDDAEAERMEALEAKILATLGIANPYTR